MEDVECAMHDFWCIAYGVKATKKSGRDKDDAEEITLGSPYSDKDKVCHSCQEKGHISRNCPAKKNKGSNGSGNQGNQGANSGKECNFCDKKGHNDSRCWDNHVHLRPSWFKGANTASTETNVVTGFQIGREESESSSSDESCVRRKRSTKKKAKAKSKKAAKSKKETKKRKKKGSTGYEICIMMADMAKGFLEHQFPDSFGLLKDNTIFICDTGTSVHMSKSAKGLHDLKGSSRGLLCADGNIAPTVAQGTLKGEMHDNQ